ncbi:MAG: glycosyltransferase family 39 protein [Candidatus Saccharimonadales bacterium]
MRLNKIRVTLWGNWPQLVLYAVLIAVFSSLLWFNLGSLTGGYSPQELQTTLASTGWRHIFEQPVNAPYLVAVRLLSYLFDNHLLITRVVSAVVGLATLALFYILVRYWHGERTALVGTLLFGFSAWFLHTARLGVPDVLLFGILALVACYLWLRNTGSGLALLGCFILAGALLYVPGMVWFIALGALLQWKSVDRYFKKNLWAVTAGGLLLIIALVPLGMAIYNHPEVAKVYAGLPATGWPMPFEVLKNIALVPVHIFWQGQVQPEHWLSKLAVLDYFTTAMFFLGGYLYIRNVRLRRFWLMVAILSAGTVLVSLGGAVSLTILVPFLYIIAAAGIGFLIDNWITVFPRNVIAQSVGYGLVSLAVVATCTYSVRHYFVAWPQAQATKAVFTVKEQPRSDTIH